MKLSIGFKTKIGILVGTLVLFTLGLAWFFIHQMGSLQQYSTTEASKTMRQGFERTLQYNVQSLASQLAPKVQAAKDAGTSVPEAIQKELESVRYGEDGYYWAYDTDVVLVAHAANPALIGEAGSQKQDKKGNYYRKEMVEKAQAGGGFSEYWFPKPGQTEPKPKLAYSQTIPGTSYVLSTGIYIDEIQAQTAAFEATTGAAIEQSIHEAGRLGLGVFLLVILPLALLLVRSITKPLARAATFAQAVAKGDFSREFHVSGNDEVAKVGLALKTIPEALNHARQEFEGLVSAVERGELGMRADASALEGEFAQILEGGNTVAETYSKILDNIPMPFAIMDQELNVRHMNSAALSSTGLELGQARKVKCHEAFQLENCDHGNCSCVNAMRTMQPAHNETTAGTGDNIKDIAYTGVPLTDRSGKLVAVMEVIQDLTEIRSTQRRIEHTAREATKIAERLASASDELSAQVEEVNAGADVQRQRMAETATAMEQMNATAVEVAQNAGGAAKGLEDSRAQATEGSKVIRETVAAIEGVNSEATEAKKAMSDLGQKAEAIGQVMNVISDIADQTNLLALNAAIEAARAGDAGRGFAVVADEVRKLAEKTMAATSEVGSSIHAIQEAARGSVASAEASVAGTAKAVELVSRSGDVFAAIVTQVEENAARVMGISAAAEEQSAASEQVVAATMEVGRIVDETADGMNNSTLAVRELANMSSELSSLMGDHT